MCRGYIGRGISPRRIDSIYGATCHRGRGFWPLKFPWECFPARGMEKSRGDRGFDRLEELRPETSSERLHCTCIDVNRAHPFSLRSPSLRRGSSPRFLEKVFLFFLSFWKWKYEVGKFEETKREIYIYINFLIYAPVHGRGFIAYGLVFYRSIKSSLSISFKILSKNCNVIKIIDKRE